MGHVKFNLVTTAVVTEIAGAACVHVRSRLKQIIIKTFSSLVVFCLRGRDVRDMSTPWGSSFDGRLN